MTTTPEDQADPRSTRAPPADVPVRESAWFVALVEQAPDAAFVHDEQGTLLEVNRRACESLGYTREELVGKHVLDFELNFDEAGVRSAWSRLVPGAPLTLSGRHRRKDGTAFPVEIRVTTIEVDGARRYLAFARDVTEREVAEAALRASEERARARAVELEAILDCVADGVIVYDREGRAVRSTAEADRILGYTAAQRREPARERLPRQYEILSEDGRPLAPDEISVVRASVHGETVRGEVVRLRPLGAEPRWISTNATPLVLDGKHVGAVLSITDLTERKRAEEELRRLEAAVEQTPASIVITDTDGTIRYVNPAFERVTGYSRAEAIGRKPNLVKSGRHDAAFYRSMWDVIGRGEVWKGQLVNRARDGRLFVEDAVIAPVFGKGGEIRNYVAVKRDVTEELRIQEGLAQAQRLESIGRLAGGVAHDFNNLLTVILSATEVLRQDLAAGVVPSPDLADEIGAAGRRAAELTKQLLAFARRQAIAPKPVDLNATLVGMERLLRRALGEDVSLRVAPAPGLWTTCCDPGQLEQVVMNLVVNARDALPGGGTVSLETRNDPGYGQWVVLTVRDDGVGMTPEVKAHLFEPFFTTKGPGKGTGLGLATAYGIVRQNGGDIRVESEPGRGSTFEVRLPRWSGPAGPAVERAEPGASGGTELVLLVEDEPAVREVGRRALADGGYQVLTAPNAGEALSILQRPGPAPDLVVTDVVMPGMNGRQLAERVRERHPGVRVLFVSGYNHDVIQHEGVLDPGVDFLAKPFTPASLRAKVRAILDGR